MMQRKEHCWRGRGERRDEEGRFAGAGRRGGEHEGSRFTRGQGAPHGWGQGEEQEHRHQWDDDYHHWRNEQLRKFDQDYEDWRNERRKKFSEDFDKWRSARPERAEGSRITSQADNRNK